MQLEDLEVVLKVAEFQNITAAAKELDMRVATASAALKRVEQKLGAELFIRSTRQLRLSNAGERFLPQCQQALHTLENARQNIRADLDTVEGELRIAVSSDLGRNLAIQWFDKFIESHPNVSLKVNISDSNIDFYRDSVDVALRYGSPSDANLYGFKICNVPAILCANPEYLKSVGTPKHPHDLVAYNGLFYQLHDIIHDVWTFSDNKNKYKIKMNGNRASNDGDLVRRWCNSGKGLAVKSCLDISNELLTGKLVNALPKYQPRPSELWLICPSRQSITPAIRLLRDALRGNTAEILHKLVQKNILHKSILKSL